LLQKISVLFRIIQNKIKLNLHETGELWLNPSPPKKMRMKRIRNRKTKNGGYTSFGIEMVCSWDGRAFLILFGKPWYNVSLVFGGREAGRDAW
jgi:hypothetical protein